MTELELYRLWMSKELEDADLTAELKGIENKDSEIKDRFYRQLEFGTAGLRGVIGAGTNRMNLYTVGVATQGLSEYLLEKYNAPKVAIAFDSRNKSELFAKVAAEVLAANGIKTYLYRELMPTPMLSFAVRDLKCSGGIVITASHNPAKYNGYKAYGPDGCQMTSEAADAVLLKIGKLDLFADVKRIPFAEGLSKGVIEYIGDDLIDRYLNRVMEQSVNPDAPEKAGLKVVYTPLNGTGNRPVRKIFDKIGITGVEIVKEQELPDGNFPTCPFPNPEIKEALDLGLKLCEKTGADILIATDPDCDRVGIAVKDTDGYQLLSGNEVGALLLQYIAESRIAKGTMPEKPIAVKSIVTTNIAKEIGKDYGIEVIDVLTGFKYIGEQIGMLESKGQESRYLLGFEESYGYLAGTYVRDKDAVVASMLICEMASTYKLKGISMSQALEQLYGKYGRYLHTLGNFVCEGAEGMERMGAIMAGLRNDPPQTIGGFAVVTVRDYQNSTFYDCKNGTEGTIDLPSSDALAYELENSCSVIIRPSGTEPKIKAYFTVKAKDLALATEIEKKINADTVTLLGF